jgi:hypothetical protein
MLQTQRARWSKSNKNILCLVRSVQELCACACAPAAADRGIVVLVSGWYRISYYGYGYYGLWYVGVSVPVPA